MMKWSGVAPALTALCVVAVTVDVVSSLPRSREFKFDEELDSSSKCRRRYGYRYYYDHGTDHCEQCREICQNAEIMGTEQQCGTECAPYLEAMKCRQKEDMYYDQGLDLCSPCSDICDKHQATGTTRTCREMCSAYLEKLTPKQVPSHHKQNYLKAVDGSEEGEESQSSDLLMHPGWIAAMAVGGLALVCVVVIIIVFYWTCHQQKQQQQQQQQQHKQHYSPAPQADVEEAGGERPGGEEGEAMVVEGEREMEEQRRRRPVEETSQGSSGSQHFAIDGASSRLPTIAFAELPLNRSPIVRV